MKCKKFGFTLIEILMVLVLLGLLLYGLYAVLFQSIAVRERTDKQSMAIRSGKAVLNVIMRDLRNISLNRAKPEHSLFTDPSGTDDNRQDTLCFLTIVGFDPTRANRQNTELKFVKYRLVTNTDKSNLYTLVRYSSDYDPRLSIPGDIDRNALVMADNVVSFKITCKSQNPESNEWEDRWRSTAIRLPSQSITTAGDDTADRPPAATTPSTSTSSSSESNSRVFPPAVRIEIKLDLTPRDELDKPQEEHYIETFVTVIDIPDFYLANNSFIWGDRASREPDQPIVKKTAEPKR